MSAPAERASLNRNSVRLDGLESRIARSERTLMWVIFVATAILQFNGVLHHGFMAQDWASHSETAAQAAQMPAFRWIAYVGTNPPALYWLAGFLHWTTGTTAYIAATSFVLVVLNLVALWGWARLAREVIGQASLRVALLVTMAFLPFRVIHSTVFAGDTVCVLPFTLLPWLLRALIGAFEVRRRLTILVALCAVLVVGVASKYTMASAVPVALGLLLVLRRALPTRRLLVAAILLVGVVPGAFAVYQQNVYSHLPDGPFKQQWLHEMDWRSLLTVRAADVDVLRAPLYTEKLPDDADQYNLLVNNRHSYPALLHLSMFTDPMNVYASDPTDAYFGPRDGVHQALMTVAVNAAIPLSLLMLFATGVFLFRTPSYLRGLRVSMEGRPLLILTVLGFSGAFFANIAAFLPFVRFAYFYGYWQARLVMPALLGFCFLGFALLDEKLRRPGARLTVLAYAVAQAALHASFLWVRGP